MPDALPMHAATAGSTSDLGWCTAEPDHSEEAAKKAVEINPLNAPDGAEAAIANAGGLLTKKQPLTGSQSRFWRNGSVLRVAFTNGSLAQRRAVMRVAAEWSDHANIQFRMVSDRTDPAPDIRISFDTRRNWSRVGTDSRLSTEAGHASMTFAGFTPSRGTILHEFGHALGLKHEHQNPTAKIDWNKEQVYADLALPPNNWTKARVDGNVFAVLTDPSLNYSRFDPDSVMGYHVPARWTNDGFSTSPADRLSPQDISYIGDWYPFGGSQRASRIPATHDLVVLTRGISRRVFEKTWERGRWLPRAEDWSLALDGEITGHVGVAPAHLRGHLHAVARAEAGGGPIASSRLGGRWTGWEKLGGGMTGSPTVIWTGDETWAFVRGVSGQPFYKVRGADWSRRSRDWRGLGGRITGLIAADVFIGKIALAVRGASGRCCVKWWDGGSWLPGDSGWTVLEGTMTAHPTVAWFNDQIHVVVRAPGGEPQHRIIDVETGRPTGPWHGLRGGIIGTPLLVSGQDGSLHLLVRGNSRSISHKRFDDRGWSPGWENLGGRAVDSPTAVALPRVRDRGPELHVFVTGTSRRGFRKIWDGTSWRPGQTRWESLGGQLA